MILSLQGLRAIAIGLIFVSHRFPDYDFLGCTGVSIFFVLSGFLTFYSSSVKNVEFSSYSTILRFYWNKWIKFYPLHLITFLMAALLQSATASFYFGKVTVANLLLLQSFIPNSRIYFSYNATSWFLCDLFFYILLFPIFFHFLKKRSVFILGFYGLLVYFAMVSFSACFLFKPLQPYTHAILYIHPGFRIWEIFLGCILAKVFLACNEHRTHLSFDKICILEICSTCLMVVSIFFAEKIPLPFRYCTYYTLCSLFLIFPIAFQSGIVSRILRSKILVFVGNISFEIFLLHQLILRWYSFLATKYSWEIDFTVATILLIVITLVSSYGVHLVLNRLYSILRFPSNFSGQDKQTA